MGKTIEENIVEMEARIGVSKAEIIALNQRIWDKEYLENVVTSEDFAIAVGHSRRLEEVAKANGITGETMAGILLTQADSAYYRDKKAGKASDEAYKIAMRGLEHAEKPGTKVSLLNIASNAKAELVNDFERASELADESCEIAKHGSDVDWGKAENNAALKWLNLANRLVSSDETEKAKSAFYNAIEHFKKALEAHKKAGNTRGQGHAHNNMILCYQGLAKIVRDSRKIGMCDKALEQAELAKKAYGDDPGNAIHTISANYRKGQTYELKAEMYALQSVYLFINLFYAIQCYTENLARALELDKPEKVKQELANIQKVIDKQIEMQRQEKGL
jgi:tetratricopeptide (TPR) repeat protein